MQETNIFKLIRTVELFTNASIVSWTKTFQHNIGISSILVLAELRANGMQKQSTLSNALGYTPGAMTNIANKLIKDGYAAREYNENDRRIVLLTITEEGLIILADAQQKGREMKGELFSVLSQAEIEHFLNIHEKLLKSLES